MPISAHRVVRQTALRRRVKLSGLARHRHHRSIQPCPKCGSTEIYADDRGIVNASGGIMVLNLHDMWFGSKAAINTYLCASCGYLEMFLADTEKLPDIVRTWRRVGA